MTLLLGSLSCHVALGVMLLATIRQVVPGQAPPTVDVVFETAASAVPKAIAKPAAPDALTLDALTPDPLTPDQRAPNPVAPDSVAPSSVARDSVAPDSVAMNEAPQPTTPDRPAEPATASSEPVTPPAPEPSAAQAAPELAPTPVSPLPLPAPPRSAPVRTAAPPPPAHPPARPAAARAPNSPLPETAPARPPAKPAPVLSARPPSAQPAAPPAPVVINAAWRGAVAAWVQARRRYPDEARRRNIEGDVVLRFTVNRDGQALDATILHPSGSDLLDQAATTLVHDGRVPPFPADMTQPQVTISIAVRYHLED